LEKVSREEKSLVCPILTKPADGQELPYLLIHRFFLRIHTSGIRQMHVILGTRDPEIGPHRIECPHASILYRLDNGSQVYRKRMIKFIIVDMGWTAQSVV
jgi:hypothetical protein